MDKINQIRRLAGMPYDLTKDVTRGAPTKKTTVKEAYGENGVWQDDKGPYRAASRSNYRVPETKGDLMPHSDANHSARVGATKQAITHLQSAIKQLEAIPAMDFNGDIPHFVDELYQLLGSNAGDGLHGLATAYSKDHDKFKTKEASRVKSEQEEEEMSNSSHDAVGHHEESEGRLGSAQKFEAGQKASLHGKPVVVVVASDGSETVGVAPCGEEGNVASIELVHANELEPSEEGADDVQDVEDDPIDMGINLDGDDDSQEDTSDQEKPLSDEEDPDEDDPEIVALGSGDHNDDIKKIHSDIGGPLGECTPGAWVKTRDGQAGVVARVEGNTVVIKPHNTPDKPITTTLSNIVEGGMPAGVIKAKQRLSQMSSEELATYFKNLAKEKGRTVEEQTARTSRLHAYKNNHYWGRISQHVKEGVNYYYDKEDEGEPENVKDGTKNGNTVWKEVNIKNPGQVKDENPNQLFSLGAASATDMDRKVKIPASVKSSLKKAIDEVEEGFKRLSAVENDAHFFYNSLLNAFEQLLQYLDVGTVYSVKQAQIFMTSLMGPILFKIPADVKNFIAKGGETKSLKDYMKPVDAKYPITGPRNTLK